LSDGSILPIDLSSAEARLVWNHALAGRRLRNGRYLRGAFYLGSKVFYDWLRNLDGDAFEGLSMTRVADINQLYGGHEARDRVQRRDARFFNTCMMATARGAAVSDALESGQVVSGVGGQYNFVAMAHELEGGRSVLMLRSTRTHKGALESNVLWNYGHTTIPRHLRDIYVTEYGIADLRGKSDEDCVIAMLALADARFQDRLAAQAQATGKPLLDVARVALLAAHRPAVRCREKTGRPRRRPPGPSGKGHGGRAHVRAPHGRPPCRRCHHHGRRQTRQPPDPTKLP